jgi:anti-sigma-K factor RskA
MRLSPRRDAHALAGAYALDALDTAERERFERHLRGCRACQAEVRGFAATAASLARAASIEPPPGLKERVLAAAAVTRQLPPEVTVAAAGEPRRRHESTAPARRSPWVPRLALAVGGGGLVAAAVLGYVTVSTQDQLTTTQSQGQELAAVLTAPDARITSSPTSAGGTATVVASPSEGKMVFTSSGLQALPSSKVYQMWFVGPGSPRSAGLVPPASSNGSTAPVLASGLESGDKVAVTVEPAGGTSQPTTTPIVVLTLPA